MTQLLEYFFNGVNFTPFLKWKHKIYIVSTFITIFCITFLPSSRKCVTRMCVADTFLPLATISASRLTFWSRDGDTKFFNRPEKQREIFQLITWKKSRKLLVGCGGKKITKFFSLSWGKARNSSIDFIQKIMKFISHLHEKNREIYQSLARKKSWNLLITCTKKIAKFFFRSDPPPFPFEKFVFRWEGKVSI